jgi:predicted acyltransferase
VSSELLARLTELVKVGQSGTSVKGWIVSNIFRPAFGDLNGSLAFAVFTVVLMLLLMTPLHKRGILIRV